MEIIYGNTEEQFIETILSEISDRTSSKIKSFAIGVFVVLIFGGLCLSKYNYDMDVYGYLTEASSLVLLIYIICGILWIILLPIIWWKIKSVLIIKQIESKKIKFEGNVKFNLREENLIITTEDSKIESPWNNVLSIIVKKKFLVLNLRGFEGILIPMESFKTEEDSIMFINYINEKIQLQNEYNIAKDKEV